MSIKEKLSDPLFYAITSARVRLTTTNGLAFYAALVNPLQIVEANDWCKSICTDGVRLYVNRDFILSMNISKLMYVLAHEAVHLALDHLSRRGSRERDRWGMAIDYYVNWILKHEVSDLNDMPTENILYEESFDNEVTPEDIYDVLEKNKTDIQMTLDDHLDYDDLADTDEDGNPNASASIKGGNGKGPPKMSREEIEKIRADMKAQLIQLSGDPSTAGSIPGAIKRMIDDLLEPKLDWREMIRATFMSSIKSDVTYSRMSRRSYHGDYLQPGAADSKTIDIACTLDTSGSMTEEMLRELLSEVKGIMLEFPGFKIRLWTFDTDVHGFKEFDNDNLDEIDSYYPEGGGGTLFECNWTFMQREDFVPERLIFFTDGYPCGGWGEEDYCDVLWIIHGTAIKQRIKGPFGTTVYYELNQE